MTSTWKTKVLTGRNCHWTQHINTRSNAPLNFTKRLIFSLPPCKALRSPQLFCNSVLKQHLPGGVGGRWKNA